MSISSQFTSKSLVSQGRLIYDPTPARSRIASVSYRNKRSNADVRFSEKQTSFSVRAGVFDELSAAVTTVAKSINPNLVKGVITITPTIAGLVSGLGSTLPLIDDTIDPTSILGRTLLLELVSSELDPETGEEKETIKGFARRVTIRNFKVIFECLFSVPVGFGRVGAVKVDIVEKLVPSVMFLDSIALEGLPEGAVTFNCNSWLHSNNINDAKRVFFSNKSYLPSETPAGLVSLREEEMENLRGNGQGERQKPDRIYDYDVYNDLGDPDTDADLKRPVLGGAEHPYPRRCRTGRPMCATDPESEQRSTGSIYVPRDEAFGDIKQLSFGANLLKSGLHAVIPTIVAGLTDPDKGFPYFNDIDSLFDDGFDLPPLKGDGLNLPRFFMIAGEIGEKILRFENPQLIDCDKFSWLKDEEFSRQLLAGLNPYSIELVKPENWPLTSKLDSDTYGSPDSLITNELVEEAIGGDMTVEQALADKRLFLLDYHDLLLPYVQKVRELEGRMLYGSRTLLYRNDDHTLRLIVIELTKPKQDRQPQWRQVFKPSTDPTEFWLWRLAKAHVAANDAGYHQLVIHWLRTHCCTEPYIIATNRQLSAMHPINRLLQPYFRYTMEINAQARSGLINADGIIESSFSPGKYSMELSSVAYDKTWRFDMEALPADLIRRGMAEPDPTAEHGLKLAIEDYPFANDGLILWDAIKQWVTDYVNHYYPEPAMVDSDTELQAWWTEVRTEGHGDKKDESWWPVLNTKENLIQVLSTIIWVTSGHHAAVNFGQFPYAGYFPNRPSITRTKMPTEEEIGEGSLEDFLKKPELALLETYPSRIQATKVMTTLNILSSHSPDEEYVGEKAEASWKDDAVINAAFERFRGRLVELEGVIDGRNADLSKKNRSGAGIVPYELLKPTSDKGVTGKGVPNSISI